MAANVAGANKEVMAYGCCVLYLHAEDAADPFSTLLDIFVDRINGSEICLLLVSNLVSPDAW